MGVRPLGLRDTPEPRSFALPVKKNIEERFAPASLLRCNTGAMTNTTTTTATETTTQRAYYSVPHSNLAYLLERIEKLNKRCKRLGIPAIEVAVELDYVAHEFRNTNGRVWVPEVDLDDARAKVAAQRYGGMEETGQVMEWHEVAIKGEAPCYAGWKFVATLEPLPVGGGEAYNLLMTVPGEECPTSYMKPEAVGRCDHCNMKRNRKQTFVVRHEDGTHKAVGRQCLKDFLGHQNPNTLATWAEMLAELGSMGSASEEEDWLGMGGTYETTFDLEYFLSWTAGVIRNHGWVSKGKAYCNENLTATVYRVNELLSPPKFCGKDAALQLARWQEEHDKCEPNDADKKDAADATEWALELDIEALMEKDGESYLANVAALARARVVGPKTQGIGGSIVAVWARARDKALKQEAREEREATLPSKHVGEPKVRDTYRVKVETIILNEGMYGLTRITKMLVWDEERQAYANETVWFATTEHKLEEGGEYTVKATVKAHEAYEGRAQTIMTRVALVKAPAAK